MSTKKLEDAAKQIEGAVKMIQKTKEQREAALLGTGSTMLNLALSGKAHGGFPAGSLIYFVGDSSSGKTFFTLTCFAEAKNSPAFENYRLIFDNVENGALMDFEAFFGKKVAATIEPPNYRDDGSSKNSYLIEEMYANLDRILDESAKKKVPVIYVVDSLDALTSRQAEVKADETIKAVEKGTALPKSFGDGKAKYHSENLRRIVDKIERSQSIVIFISQTRDNVDGGMFEAQQIHAGGRALKFYASAQIWTSATDIKEEIKGKDRQIGIRVNLKVKKNRVSGKNWAVTVPLYWSYGIDDLGSCINFLLEEKVFEKVGNKVRVDLDEEDPDVMYSKDILKYVEANNLEDKVRERVQRAWDEIEAACRVDRKKRYE